jgi:hypothetical protein
VESECVLGHVLVHAHLGLGSPELMGRGLEEGLAELLGSLKLGADVLGSEAAEAVFAATRLTPASRPQRERFLDELRRADALHRGVGLGGLVTLVERGRPAIKEVELSLRRGDLPRGLAGDLPDQALAERFERLMARRGRPLALPPLAFQLGRRLEAGMSVGAVARELGLEPEAARRAASELVQDVHLAIIDGDGRVLAEDLGLLASAGGLRYAIP